MEHHHLHILTGSEVGLMRIEKGLAMDASLPAVRAMYSGATLERDYDTAFRERLTEPIARGELNNRPGFRDDGYRVSGLDALRQIMYIGPTTYKELLHTNRRAIADDAVYAQLRTQSESGRKFPHLPNAQFSDMIGLTSTLHASDGIILFKRGKNVAFYKEWWHMPGGMMETYDEFPVGFFDNAAVQMRREFDEEIGINASPELTGLVDGVSSLSLTYRTAIGMTGEQIAESQRRAKEASEHTSFVVLETPGIIVDFVRKNPIVPVGLGALILDVEPNDCNMAEELMRISREHYPVQDNRYSPPDL